jgi:hypothetical protein
MKLCGAVFTRRQFVAGASYFAGCAVAKLYSGKGRLIMTHLDSAPFPHPERAQGREYKGQFYPAQVHYSDSTTAVFVPAGFRETGRIDFVVHFHGWRNNVAHVLEHYQLLEQFELSGRNAILVVPQGPRDAPDSFGGKLEDPGGFQRFMNDVLATLRDRSVLTNRDSALGSVILSGHSGGYQVMASILDRGGLTGQVSEVWLFDALYARADSFLAWLQHQHGRLLDLYTDHGGTKEETERFMTSLKRLGLDYIAGNESEMPPSKLRPRQPIFLHSELEHDAVMQGNRAFLRMLQSSFLSGI